MADWRHDAICRDEDPELFFPIGEEHTSNKAPTGPVQAQQAEAKTVCRRCPVVTDCLAWAIESGQDFGVWGASTPEERRAFKRRSARTRARSNA
jgi:WhiB family transcriptional regulator, redox-sensing transcriptional regulator